MRIRPTSDGLTSPPIITDRGRSPPRRSPLITSTAASHSSRETAHTSATLPVPASVMAVKDKKGGGGGGGKADRERRLTPAERSDQRMKQYLYIALALGWSAEQKGSEDWRGGDGWRC